MLYATSPFMLTFSAPQCLQYIVMEHIVNFMLQKLPDSVACKVVPHFCVVCLKTGDCLDQEMIVCPGWNVTGSHSRGRFQVSSVRRARFFVIVLLLLLLLLLLLFTRKNCSHAWRWRTWQSFVIQRIWALYTYIHSFIHSFCSLS